MFGRGIAAMVRLNITGAPYQNRIVAVYAALMLIAVILGEAPIILAYDAVGSKRILVIASDIDDVFWARKIQEALSMRGINVRMEVMYLWNKYQGAGSEREKLQDIGFLWRYAAILIPDLNKDYTYGGRLTSKEVENLLLYAKRGHLLLLGMNTFIQHWHLSIEDAAGVQLIGVSGAKVDTDLYDIVYEDRVYQYNDTLGAALVAPKGSIVIARFRYELKPAITVNRYGSGIVVFAAFNVVEAALSKNNGEQFTGLLADVLAPLLAQVKPLPPPSNYVVKEKIKRASETPLKPLQEIYQLAGGGIPGLAAALALGATFTYAVLLTAVYMCIFSPERGALVLRPLTLLKKRLGSLEKKISIELSEEIAQTISELSAQTKLPRRTVCRTLSWLLARGQVAAIRTEEETYYALPDKAPLAFVMSNPIYQQIVSLVEKEPGITIHEVAARMGIPFDTAFTACKELASQGIIEMRKVMLEYELYPLRRFLESVEKEEAEPTNHGGDLIHE